jgi:hypothetical protein
MSQKILVSYPFTEFRCQQSYNLGTKFCKRLWVSLSLYAAVVYFRTVYDIQLETIFNQTFQHQSVIAAVSQGGSRNLQSILEYLTFS